MNADKKTGFVSRKRRAYPAWLLALALICVPLRSSAAEPLELKDGDRVVLIGSTLIEREQKYGYWETVLTLRHPDKNITFRNLGWSGDTVWGEARAGFDTAKEGYRRLVEHTLALKPTVIVVGYGTNEAFAGEAGLPRFREGLTALLDALAPAKARVALLAPLPMEKHPAPLPDPAVQNGVLGLYRSAIQEVARVRGHEYLDVLELCGRKPMGPPEELLTDNGLHLTEYGYWRTALAWHTEPMQARISLQAEQPQRQVLLPVLPFPSPPSGAPATCWRRVASPLIIMSRPPVTRIPGGLKIDGRLGPKFSPRELDEVLAKGPKPFTGPDHEQVELLRQKIIQKNQLYFHRWRPQNVTYLFGFRKHEQGQNAREIPQFDPLIEKLEAEIARLRKPVPHTYEIVPARESEK